MGQKVNLITLRSEKFQKNIYSSTESIFVYSFLELLKIFFWQNKIFLTQITLYLQNNKIYYTFFIFFRVVKLLFFFGKRCKKVKNIKKVKINSYSKLKNVFSPLIFLKKNLFIFKFVNLNYFLKKKYKLTYFFFKKFKKAGLILFPRRYNFFLDFIQITILFIENKINIKFFINIFVEIFRILQKKKHAKFLSFFSTYFNELLLRTNKKLLSTTILGVKFMLSGKIKGKPRSSTFNQVFGTVPIQTLRYNIEYSRAHAFTLYGVFGIKLWVFRKS